MPDNRLCVALDTHDPDEALRLARVTEDQAGVFKVGLTAFVAGGDDLVREVARRRPVFLDLKFHDIPAQVRGAVEGVVRLGCSYTTVHAAGGEEMVAAAVEGAGGRLAVLAVTVLTSIDDATLADLGVNDPAEKQVLRLAEVALRAGADGIVCSPLEIDAVRRNFGPSNAAGPLIVVPGIRPVGTAVDDQRRAASPRVALGAGADLIVVGRPITHAPDPAAAAAAVLADIE
ncbi:MAG: orotidine-5'-phosphate decarboxylase [Actinomycetota bacterium]|nr:orotidine-5'-phosphate decarboxylase [Actinomycetota bacterium]